MVPTHSCTIQVTWLPWIASSVTCLLALLMLKRRGKEEEVLLEVMMGWKEEE